MTTSNRGHRELDHTADWTLEVWAPDWPTLLEEAALGMYEMSGVSREAPRGISRRLELEANDREARLVGFLSELIYWLQVDRVAFAEFHWSESEPGLRVELIGGPIDFVDKEIKAVTWYDVAVESRDDGLEARVTFDV